MTEKTEPQPAAAGDSDDPEGLKRKNAELLAEVKKLKGRIADLEAERDNARAKADGAQATMRRVQLDEPVEAALGNAFVAPWRVMKPLVEEHFGFDLGEDGKPVVTAKQTGEAVALDAIHAEMAAIPDLAAAMRPPSGGGAPGSEGSGREVTGDTGTKRKKVEPQLGLR